MTQAAHSPAHSGAGGLAGNSEAQHEEPEALESALGCGEGEGMSEGYDVSIAKGRRGAAERPLLHSGPAEARNGRRRHRRGQGMRGLRGAVRPEAQGTDAPLVRLLRPRLQRPASRGSSGPSPPAMMRLDPTAFLDMVAEAHGGRAYDSRHGVREAAAGAHHPWRQ